MILRRFLLKIWKAAARNGRNAAPPAAAVLSGSSCDSFTAEVVQQQQQCEQQWGQEQQQKGQHGTGTFMGSLLVELYRCMCSFLHIRAWLTDKEVSMLNFLIF